MSPYVNEREAVSRCHPRGEAQRRHRDILNAAADASTTLYV